MHSFIRSNCGFLFHINQLGPSPCLHPNRNAFKNQNMKNNLFSGWNNCDSIRSAEIVERQAFNNNYAFGTHTFYLVMLMIIRYILYYLWIDVRWHSKFQMLSRAIKHENTVFASASRLWGRHILKCWYVCTFSFARVKEAHIGHVQMKSKRVGNIWAQLLTISEWFCLNIIITGIKFIQFDLMPFLINV